MGASRNAPSSPANRAATQLPIVVMYHRVHSITCDPWQLGVTPEHLSEQLEVLSCERDVVPLSWLVGKLKEGQMPRGAVALTFDDGYVDVLINGRPILEKHDCPATMFLTTGAIGSNQGFWWDILARIVLETASLPDHLTLEIRGRSQSWRLSGAQQQPESAKAPCDLLTYPELLRAIWASLKPLQPDERSLLLESLAAWAGTDAGARESDRSLTRDEAGQLFDPGFIDVGAHTVTHPSLVTLSDAERRWEIAESRTACEELTGSRVEGFSYPFGDLDDACVAAVHRAGFEFACTTAEESVTSTCDLVQLPRIRAGDWGEDEFRRKVLRYG